MNSVDLWSQPYTPSEPIKKEKLPQPEPKKRGRPKKDAPKDLSKLYVITAGINKSTGRQLFISTYEDSDEWSVSAVPFIMDKKRASELLEKAQQYVNDNPKRYRYKPPTLVLETLENQEIFELVRCLLG